ncbi:hypothetical protein [Microlunatus sp. GCM10028923]|uniref:hypothetical protein n=1 Tax=Microlunatus sp. GCM10028923 TaxID=3273400 RepID=UPI00361DA730
MLLELRPSDELDPDVLTRAELRRVPDLVDRELLTVAEGRLVLTLSGRLLAEGARPRAAGLTGRFSRRAGAAR